MSYHGPNRISFCDQIKVTPVFADYWHLCHGMSDIARTQRVGGLIPAGQGYYSLLSVQTFVFDMSQSEQLVCNQGQRRLNLTFKGAMGIYTIEHDIPES